MEKPIATRTLYLVDDKSKQFTIQIFAPKISSDTGAYSCEVKILGAPDGLDHLVVGGNDSYQALTIAISALQTMVEAFNDGHMNSKLRYLEDNDTDLKLKVVQS